MSDIHITLPRPDDWHVHLRDGAMLEAVVAATAAVFARAIVMPNLKPPVVTAADAAAYRARIVAALGDEHVFEPLMTCYLTDRSDAADLAAGARDGVITAVKLYPAGATTNSDAGVTNIDALDGVFEALADAGTPLLVHGEVVDPDVDVFDREARFIEQVLGPLRARHPALKIVFEHVTTSHAVDFVMAQSDGLTAATITPHHLAINRNAMFDGGIRPHAYCLPVLKRETHRQRLVAAACSGDARFFLGTDSAPHARGDKESDCGCAGIFNAPTAMPTYLEVFHRAGALDKLPAFAGYNGARFYGLAVNTSEVTWCRDSDDGPVSRPDKVDASDVVIFSPPWPAPWRVADDA